MGAIEDHHIFAIQIRESANDGSDFGTPDADYRLAFLGEDGLWHVKDSSDVVTSPATALTDHTHAATGSGANGGGATLTPGVLNVPQTAAPGTTEGRIGWDATNAHGLAGYDSQRARGISSVGWTPWATQPGNPLTAAWGTTRTIAANGGTVAIPIYVAGHMLLESVVIWQRDTASARSWRWDLYVQDLNNGNAGENTLRRVAVSNGSDAFTPGAASARTLGATGAPVYLPPGTYWLAVQCDHATNSLALGTTSMTLGLVSGSQSKTTTNPNGATLDFVAATWTKLNEVCGVFLKGRVFGETTSF